MTPKSLLAFRSERGFSVWTCACGCDQSVKVEDWQLSGLHPDHYYFFVAHHAPYCTVSAHKGPSYAYEAFSEAGRVEIPPLDDRPVYALPERPVSDFLKDVPTDPVIEWMLTDD